MHTKMRGNHQNFDMNDYLDFRKEYENKVRPKINKCIKSILLTFFAIILILIATSELLEYFDLPEKLILFILFPSGLFFVYQTFRLSKIRCPNCEKPLFTSYRTYYGKNCKHCGAKFWTK